MGPNAGLMLQKALKSVYYLCPLVYIQNQQNQVNKQVKCVLSINVLLRLLLCFICTNLSADVFVQSVFIRHKQQPMYDCTDISWS